LVEDYNLVLPTITFKDKLTLDMGDLKIRLYYFGKTNNLKGNIIAVIPEDKVMFTGMMVHAHSLAPRIPSFLDGMDIQKWLRTYDSIFEENDLEIAVLGNDPWGPGFWSINRIHLRHEYILMLWREVKNAVSEGATLEETQDRLSLDKKFSYVKEWPVHKNNEDAIRSGLRSHADNIESVFLNLHQVAAKEVYLTLEESGLEAAIEKFKEMQQNPSDYYFDSATFFTVGNKLLYENRMADAVALFKMSIEYNPDETTYNRIGYTFLGKELTDNAIEFFKLGIKAFPNSANLYDSLGEACMKAGEKDLALRNYEKSLELNPKNENAKKMLEGLRKK
jgi:tetratricopeptide (TPR) repeat protein